MVQEPAAQLESGAGQVKLALPAGTSTTFAVVRRVALDILLFVIGVIVAALTLSDVFGTSWSPAEAGPCSG